MRHKLDTADAKARKAYLQSVIAQIEVDDTKIRVFSDRAPLAAAATDQNTRTTRSVVLFAIGAPEDSNS